MLLYIYIPRRSGRCVPATLNIRRQIHRTYIHYRSIKNIYYTYKYNIIILYRILLYNFMIRASYNIYIYIYNLYMYTYSILYIILLCICGMIAWRFRFFFFWLFYILYTSRIIPRIRSILSRPPVPVRFRIEKWLYIYLYIFCIIHAYLQIYVRARATHFCRSGV